MLPFHHLSIPSRKKVSQVSSHRIEKTSHDVHAIVIHCSATSATRHQNNSNRQSPVFAYHSMTFVSSHDASVQFLILCTSSSSFCLFSYLMSFNQFILLQQKSSKRPFLYKHKRKEEKKENENNCRQNQKNVETVVEGTFSVGSWLVRSEI